VTIAPDRAALSLGGNSGNVPETFARAAELLAEGGFRIERVSSVLRTSPVDCPPGTPDFLNQAMTGFWTGTPEALLDLAQSVEVRLGRPARHGFHTPRTIDIDLVAFGKRRLVSERLILPHPEAAKRAFVLDPLDGIAPEFRAFLTEDDPADSGRIIDFHYPEDTPLKRLLLTHSRQVRDKALAILDAHPEIRLDRRFAAAAAMLHDLGIGRCDAPGILCTGSEPYLAHGLLGAAMLREYGAHVGADLEALARVCERHTGAGITAAEVRRQVLPIPARDYLPETVGEKLVCYADKFFSKSGDLQEKSRERVRRGLAKFGPDTLARFDEMDRMFGMERTTGKE